MDRLGFSHRYVVTVSNSSDTQACQVDLFHTDSRPKWSSGEFGVLIPPGKVRSIAVPDWSWMAWGGPFRVLNHVQDHPMRMVVHRDNGESSAEYEVKPWSTVGVSESDIVVTHGDPADGIAGHESSERIAARAPKWNEFVAQDNPESEAYHHKYFVRVKNESSEPVAADLLVPPDSHGLGGVRKVGFCGHMVPAGETLPIVIPDFSWMGSGGPFRILCHIQDHPLLLNVTADGKDGIPSPIHIGAVGPGSMIVVNEAGEVTVSGP